MKNITFLTLEQVKLQNGMAWAELEDRGVGTPDHNMVLNDESHTSITGYLEDGYHLTDTGLVVIQSRDDEHVYGIVSVSADLDAREIVVALQEIRGDEAV